MEHSVCVCVCGGGRAPPPKSGKGAASRPRDPKRCLESHPQTFRFSYILPDFALGLRNPLEEVVAGCEPWRPRPAICIRPVITHCPSGCGVVVPTILAIPEEPATLVLGTLNMMHDSFRQVCQTVSHSLTDTS